jgi:hypothetical protein
VIWLLAGIAGLAALARTGQLYAGLRSELELLLPQSAPSVKAIQELRRRMPGIRYLGVVVDTGDASNLPAAERFIDDLSARIARYPRSLVTTVRKDIGEEQRFLERFGPLYADLADLKEIRRRIEARRDFEAEKAIGADLDDDRKAPPLAFDDIERRYQDRQAVAQRFPRGRFSSAEHRATLLLVENAGYSTSHTRAKDLLARIRRDARDLGFPDRYAKGMRLAFTGDLAIQVEEMSALVADLTLSSLVIVGLVVLTLLLYFRWWRAVPAIFVPLLLSTGVSFTLASLPPFGVNELNSNTAFLGSIIVGNGINFGIILTARYVEERRRGVDVATALGWAVHATRIGTITAAAAAGIAYGSLTVTQFRGFWQFGVIGGLGMAVCWGLTFLLVPPLLAWLDRKPAAAPRPLGARAAWITGGVASLVQRRPGTVLIAGMALTALALAGSRTFGRDRLESDLSKLRRKDTWTTGEGHWGRKMDAVLGRYLAPIVVLTDSPAEMRKLGTAYAEAAKQKPLSELIATVTTVDSLMPTDQEAKLVEVRAIREVLKKPRVREAIPRDKAPLVEKLLGQGDAVAVRVADLPTALVVALRERDGALDRAVLLYPRLLKDRWKAERLIQNATALREIAAKHGGERPARVAGGTLLSADIMSSLLADGPLAAGVATGGVLLLLLVAFRFTRNTLLVFLSLGIGVIWLVALTIQLDLKLNFANFIAFPITLGIGVDYAVNVMSRYRHDGGHDVLGAIRSTGGAVGMCSLTTIIGYSSLLMAQNQALFSFGILAVLGEITCLVSAVILLPAALLLLDRRGRRGPAPDTGVLQSPAP